MTPSTPAVRTHVVCSGHLTVPLPTTVAGSYPRLLGPWRHAEQQHLTQCPDMVGQPRCHRWRARPPHLGRAGPVSELGPWQGLAYAGVGQAEIVVAVEHGQLLQQSVFTLAQRTDPAPDCGDMLP